MDHPWGELPCLVARETQNSWKRKQAERLSFTKQGSILWQNSHWRYQNVNCFDFCPLPIQAVLWLASGISRFSLLIHIHYHQPPPNPHHSDDSSAFWPGFSHLPLPPSTPAFATRRVPVKLKNVPSTPQRSSTQWPHGTLESSPRSLACYWSLPWNAFCAHWPKLPALLLHLTLQACNACGTSFFLCLWPALLWRSLMKAFERNNSHYTHFMLQR